MMPIPSAVFPFLVLNSKCKNALVNRFLSFAMSFCTLSFAFCLFYLSQCLLQNAYRLVHLFFGYDKGWHKAHGIGLQSVDQQAPIKEGQLQLITDLLIKLQSYQESPASHVGDEIKLLLQASQFG